MQKDDKFELISALVDGELQSEDEINQVINLLLTEPECQKKWEEYHSIRTVVRREEQPVVNLKIIEKESKKSKTFMLSAKRKHFNKILTHLALPLVATVSIFSIGLGLWFNTQNQLSIDNDQMISSLTNGTSNTFSNSAFANNIGQDNSLDNVNDKIYEVQPSSINNRFLKAHENSTNMGGLARVSFPGRTQK